MHACANWAVLFIPLTQAPFGFANTEAVRREAKTRERRGEGSSLSPPHSVIFMGHCIQRAQHFVMPWGLPLHCSVCTRRRKKGTFLWMFHFQCNTLSSVSRSLSLLVTGEVYTQGESCFMKWCFRESLPKSNTSIKPWCFRHRVLKCVYLTPYLHMSHQYLCYNIWWFLYKAFGTSGQVYGEGVLPV